MEVIIGTICLLTDRLFTNTITSSRLYSTNSTSICTLTTERMTEEKEYWMVNLLQVSYLWSKYTDPASNKGVTGRDQGKLSKTMFCKLLIGKLGLQECWCLLLTNLSLLKLQTCLYIKQPHTAWIANAASFCSGWVTAHVYTHIFTFLSVWQIIFLYI
jgi:hypothetical protein